ncbi:MAG: sulfotransferase [Bdellovibrionaceae bacterium]|nr:sulfotransferase [Pseudobdellovibrionaceae bacterium]
MQAGLLSKHPGARWLADKNPRYHLFYKELRDLFPDASFLFLLRNPLAVAASYLTTWTPGIWSLPYLEPMLQQDFQQFAAALDDTAGLHHHVMKFEDLLSQPQSELDALSRFLGLSTPLQPDRLAELSGPGDGRRAPPPPSNPSAPTAWAGVFRSPTRRRWAHRFINLLPPAYARHGYTLEALRADLESTPPRWWDPRDAIAAAVLSRIRRNAGPDLLLDLIWKARQRLKIRRKSRRHKPRPSWLE